MSWIDALYFTIETITTTGYGDFSFAHQETWLRLFAAGLMFGGATTIALLVAFIADVLLSRRFVFAAARPRVRHLRNHVIVVGLSALGMRVVTELVSGRTTTSRSSRSTKTTGSCPRRVNSTCR